MCLVVLGHMDNTAVMSGIHDNLIKNIDLIERIWTPFFMGTFFVITGYCSNFGKSFKSFFFSRIKSLIIPSITFEILLYLLNNEKLSLIQLIRIPIHNICLGPAWFLAAMFMGSIIYYCINKFLKKYHRIIICISLYIIGFILSQYLPQLSRFWSLPHTFMLLLYLEIGVLLKNETRVMGLKCSIVSLIVYLLSIISITSNDGKIGICHTIFMTWFSLFPSLLCGISASILIFNVSRFIKHSHVLEFIGRNSVIFYLSNWFLLQFYYNLYKTLFDMSQIYTICGITLTYISVLVTSSIIAYILNAKYLKFLIGK